MNNLKQVINQHYGALPKEQVVKITIDVCTQQMDIINHLIQEDGSNNNENEIINLRKAKLYLIISDGLLELQKEDRDISKIDFAKIHIKLLLEIIESENIAKLASSNLDTQETIVNEIIIPNYLIEWSLNNL